MICHFSVFLPNRVGALLELTNALAEANVHICGMDVLGSADAAVVRMVVDDPARCKDILARKGIARTFQNIQLFGNSTVMDNLMLGRHIHMKTGIIGGVFMWGKWSSTAKEEVKNREIVEHIVDFLELQSVRDQFVSSLPYGKRKLVELGRALALEPKVLLLDEPSAGMNTEEKDDLRIWIKDIQEDYQVTILLIEHDMNMVMGISDRILAINQGVKITEGIPSMVQKHPDVIAAYLGEEE